MPLPAPSLLSVSALLAEYLCSHRETVMSEWLESVRSDSRIPTDSMSTAQVRDHIPALFDDLADALRSYAKDAEGTQACRDAESHGVARWQEGYSLIEVLRELKHLRIVLIRHLLAFGDLHADFALAPRLFATTSLHCFLDEMAMKATSQFLELEQRP